MATICDQDKCVKLSNHRKDEEDALIQQDQEEEEEEEEESSLLLSCLSDNKKNEKAEKAQRKLEAQEDFNFSPGCFWEDSQMCAADEVFFKGKLLPFRHSISSETGLAMFRHDIRPFISRSQSMDHGYTSNSSACTTRSSSIRSSLSSGSTSGGRVPQLDNRKPPRVKIRNQFHSHPSPTPQIRLSSSRHRNTPPSSHHWSQKLRFFHMGSSLSVQTPDMKFGDLKIRRNTIINKTAGTNFGSRNSNTSTGTSNSGASSEAKTKNKYWEFFNECKCKVDTVDETVGRRLISVVSKSNSCVKTIGIGGDRNKEKEKEKGKQAMSRHRTFEWLKQIATVDVNVNGSRTDSQVLDTSCN